jgi:GSH-dependent disulfide-bond oxidoreductase
VIELYGGGSPNAMKIVLMLEELGLPYHLTDVKIMKGDQYTPEFVKLNPIAKYPVIVDPQGAGPDQPIFESGAILMYLAETYRPDLLPASGPERWETLKWLMAQVAWVGPMFGQHVHFRIHPSEADSYAATRYRNQVARIREVLDGELAKRPWLAGDSYTIADTWPWVAMLPNMGFDWADRPALKAWHDRIAAHPAAARVAEVRAALMRDPDLVRSDDQAFNRLFLRESGPKTDYSAMALGAASQPQPVSATSSERP